jgi:basic membrane protein A
MKKFLALLVLVVAGVLFTACENYNEEWTIIMITDVGEITDKSFNQGTWEGVEKFGKDFNYRTDYLQPAKGDTKSYEETIDLAVKEGANIIVTPGFLFETAIATSQIKYPEVKFILIDGTPSIDYVPQKVESNTVSILFQEEQPGFLAGYAAVADSYKNLGFMGGMAVPAVVKFGIGYIAGAYYAAEKLDKTITFSANRYTYLDSFENKPEHTTLATSWYDAGVEVIFAAAGGAGNSVMAAAEAKNKKVIGVDVNQAAESVTVISSAMKELAIAVHQELDIIVNGTAKNGGKILTKGAKENAIGLPQGTDFKFKTFTKAQYDELFAQIVAGTIVVPTSNATLATFLAEKCGNPSVVDLVTKAEAPAE